LSASSFVPVLELFVGFSAGFLLNYLGATAKASALFELTAFQNRVHQRGFFMRATASLCHSLPG
jgi:hypothetical protein